MSRRSTTNPAPLTESARAAIQPFYCTLCNKGYARANEFENHEASYEHNHNKRRMDLKSMNIAMSKASRSRETTGDGVGGLDKMRPISLSSLGGTKKEGGKKPGFKNAFGKKNEEEPERKVEEATVEKKEEEKEELSESDWDEEGEDWERYDPWKPTGCGVECVQVMERLKKEASE